MMLYAVCNNEIMLCAGVIIMSVVSKLNSYWKGTLIEETYYWGRVVMARLSHSLRAKMLTGKTHTLLSVISTEPCWILARQLANALSDVAGCPGELHLLSFILIIWIAGWTWTLDFDPLNIACCTIVGGSSALIKQNIAVLVKNEYILCPTDQYSDIIVCPGGTKEDLPLPLRLL